MSHFWISYPIVTCSPEGKSSLYGFSLRSDEPSDSPNQRLPSHRAQYHAVYNKCNFMYNYIYSFNELLFMWADGTPSKKLTISQFQTREAPPPFFVCFLFWFFFVCLFLFFRDRVSLCSPGCPRTHSVDQAGLELRNSLASASQTVFFLVSLS